MGSPRLCGYSHVSAPVNMAARRVVARVIADAGLLQREFFTNPGPGRPTVSPFATSGKRAHALKMLSFILLERFEMTAALASSYLGVGSRTINRHATWVTEQIADGDIRLAAEIEDYSEEWEGRRGRV